MDKAHTSTWSTIFGTAWDALSQALPDTGAFLLDHLNKTAECDNNARRMSDLTHDPDYEELSMMISELREQDNNIAMINVIIAAENDDMTAGFLRFRSSSMPELDPDLPVCTQTRLITEMSANTAPSLIALLQIEEYGNPHITNSDISFAVNSIAAALPKNALLSPAAKNKFWLYVPDFSYSKTTFLENLQKALKKSCESGVDSSCRGKSLTFTAGCGDDALHPNQRMHTAEYTLFDAVAGGIGSIYLYSDERYEQQKTEYDNMRRFTRLVDNNLFVYNFQPIISARNGDIVAYEALMRSDKSINMFPLEILGAATKLGRLYDIEKATMRNTLQYISENQSVFSERKLFVNSLPAFILSSEDWNELVTEYGELMEKLVIEMTEQTELDNDRLAIIHDRLKRSNIPLAIDDYGTGYSNTSNLLRYKPDYVKIDRSLIEGIEGKPAVQKLVSGLIDFLHENGFAALAEGVETTDELNTMIRLGVDLIQGYYISKPKPFALNEITDALRTEIEEINRMYSDEINKVYYPDAGEIVDIMKLSEEHYGSILVENDDVVLEGQIDKCVNITVMIREGADIRLTLRNACMVSEKDEPCISLGTDSTVQLWLEGSNECINRGILVPQSTELHILGSGSLHVISEMMNCYGIGVPRDQSHGTIRMGGSGKLTVEAKGENSVAIGGGKNSGKNGIFIYGGDIKINSAGGNCVGIGTIDGGSIIDISNCCIKTEMSASNSLSIGSFEGATDICIAYVEATFVMSGLNLGGIGTLYGGSGSIKMISGTINTEMHGRVINNIGSRGGELDCDMSYATLNLYSEGNSASGIGDAEGSGNITLTNCGVHVHFLSNDGMGICTKNGIVSVVNSVEDIRINE